MRRRRTTVNLVARVGERGAGRTDTLVVLAHHDAPQTGLLFDQTLQRRLYELAPQVFERVKTPAAAVVDRPGRTAVHDRRARFGGAAPAPAPA